jgi:hypothetical protein
MPSQTKKLCAKVMNRKTRKVRFNIELNKDPRVLLLYIIEQKYISPKSAYRWTADKIIQDASAYLSDEHYLFGLELKCKADKLDKISMNKLKSIIKKALTKKYLERPSPPISASILCGYILEGNDGLQYESIKSGKSCVWKKYL